MANLKTYKTYAAASRNANGKPVLCISNELYIVGLCELGLDRIELIDNGGYAAIITTSHLARLGNANYAVAAPNTIDQRSRCFPKRD